MPLLAWEFVEPGFGDWRPIYWQSGVVLGKSGFLIIYASILGTEFGSGVWLGESQLHCKCCVSSDKSLNISRLRNKHL